MAYGSPASEADIEDYYTHIRGGRKPSPESLEELQAHYRAIGGSPLTAITSAQTAAIGDRLPYAGHLDDVTLRTRDGLLAQTIHLRGFPFETASDDELNYRKAVRDTLLRGVASSRLALYHHVVRRRVSAAFDQSPVNPFCRKLDDAWKARLARRHRALDDAAHQSVGKVGQEEE